MKVWMRGLIAGALAVSAGAARADVLCGGVPAWVMMDKNEFVAADWGKGPIYLCNMRVDGGPSNGRYLVKQVSCPTIYSEFMTAMTTGRIIDAYMVDPNITTCDNLRAADGWAIKQPDQYILRR